MRPLSEQIRSARSARRWSQDTLADALGVTRQAVSGWEMGTQGPSGSNLSRLRSVLGIGAALDVATAAHEHHLLQLQGRSEELEALSAYVLSRQKALTDALRAVNQPPPAIEDEDEALAALLIRKAQDVTPPVERAPPMPARRTRR